MSKIEMSTAFTSAYTQRMVGYPTAIYSASLPQNAPLLNKFDGNSGSVWFQIMKGPVPVDFTTLVNSTTRFSDCLVRFTPGWYDGNGHSYDNFSPTVVRHNSVEFNTEYVNAITSGLATWLWILQTNVYGGTTLLQQTIGSVGLLGSGADLEIPSVDIIAGNPYRILNMQLYFPTTWTY